MDIVQRIKDIYKNRSDKEYTKNQIENFYNKIQNVEIELGKVYKKDSLSYKEALNKIVDKEEKQLKNKTAPIIQGVAYQSIGKGIAILSSIPVFIWVRKILYDLIIKKEWGAVLVSQLAFLGAIVSLKVLYETLSEMGFAIGVIKSLIEEKLHNRKTNEQLIESLQHYTYKLK